MAFLVAAGVGHHIFTYNVVPWVAEDITRHEITPDQTFHIVIKDHQFILPQEKMVIECKQKILFDVVSEDLVYGFGLFRQDHTMVTQMQVNPGSRNDLLWTFNHDGVFNVMSTEYSGPKGNQMIVKNAVEVRGCDQKVALLDGGVR
jgi:cytochrome c oxidase subunit 2